VILNLFVETTKVEPNLNLKKYENRIKHKIQLFIEPDINNLPNEVLDKVSHGLVFIDNKGRIQPALASKWKMLNNGEEFIFELKRRLLWDDGREFKAQDLKFNFKDVEYSAINDYILRFKLKKKLPVFPTYLTKSLIRPPLHGVAGLYKVDKIKSSQGLVKEVHLSPNKEGLPLIIYKFYNNESRMISAYKMGYINKMNIFKKA